MKAIVCTRYGPPEVLRLEDVAKPVPGPNEVLVRVHAAGASISDCIIRSGAVPLAMWLPFRMFVGFRRPRHPVLGIDLSGEVEAVGANVTRFKAGDPLFAYAGRRFGGYAEYVSLRDGGRAMPYDCVMAAKPANISHAEAATVPSRAMLALYFLEGAKIQRGQKVLVYGASGGIGTFVLQLAKHFGADVSAVCSGANFDLVTSLGADHVLDYTVDDGQALGGAFDVFFDAVGPKKGSALKSRCRAALAPGGVALGVDRAAKIAPSYLDQVKDLIEAGKLRPFVDRAYPLAQTASAHRFVETGHKRGGVTITVR